MFWRWGLTFLPGFLLLPSGEMHGSAGICPFWDFDISYRNMDFGKNFGVHIYITDKLRKIWRKPEKWRDF